MSSWYLLAFVVMATVLAFQAGRRLVLHRAEARLPCSVNFFGGFASAMVLLPGAFAVSFFLLLKALLPEEIIPSYFFPALIVTVTTACLGVILLKIQPGLYARVFVERAVLGLLIACALLSVFITFAVLFSILFESLRFFREVSVFDFLFGLVWSPQTALFETDVGSSGIFGAVPLIWGTLMVTFIAIFIAVPTGLFSAIYLGFYAPARVRLYLKPVLEILAGIPTVVYGFFAALFVGPLIRDASLFLHLEATSESALAAGLVMGMMLIPFISSLSDDVMRSVPVSLSEASYGIGATPSETIRLVILPTALPGLVGAFLLAVSRALGETMIVVMAAGLAANLTANPLQSVTTITVQIVTLLTGDQEFNSAKTLSAFALALLLFCITFGLNMIALHISKKYRAYYG